MSEFVEEDDNDKVRAAIVERYKRGPDGPIEPWEDASFIIYSITDRYGFLHKHPLPQYQRDEKLLEVERERAKKWIKMLANWKMYHFGDKFSEKLKRRVYKGIPDSLRGEAWKKILNLENVFKKGVYDKFRAIALDHSPDIRQIDLDVNRTYRDHIMFRDRFSVKQQALFYVLAAYSMYNTEVGYCQGMSGIAALLLMYMNEEDAFWALSELLSDRKHGMHGLFIPGFPKLLRLQGHHDKILLKLIPKMAKHLEKEGVHTSLYTLKWFMQCFLDRLPFSLVLRIYDIYMLEGDKVVIAMAYHVVKTFKKQILRMDLEGIAPLLQEEIPNFRFDDDEVIDGLQESIVELRKSKLDQPPPPSSSELAIKPPGTLPDRNSFITASKRARMTRDRTNTIEVPIGRPPSPHEPASARHRITQIGSHSSQAASPVSLNYNGVPFQQPKLELNPSKNVLPSQGIQTLPSYSEFVEQKLYSNEDGISQNSHGDLKRSVDRSVRNGSRNDEGVQFHYSQGVKMNGSDRIVARDMQRNASHSRLPSGSSNYELNYEKQNWATEVIPSHTNNIDSRKPANVQKQQFPNGLIRPQTPPRDYGTRTDFDSNKISHRKGTTHRVISPVRNGEFNIQPERDYATETML